MGRIIWSWVVDSSSLHQSFELLPHSPVLSRCVNWGNLAHLNSFLGSKVMGYPLEVSSAYIHLFHCHCFSSLMISTGSGLSSAWQGVLNEPLILDFAVSALTCLRCDLLNADGECEKGESTCEAKDGQECGIMVVSKGMPRMGALV